MSSPLRISSALAFTYSSVDLLALAGDAMTPLLSPGGRMLWQFTQGVTPEPPPGTGSFFHAVTNYTTGAYDGGGTMQHWTATIRLIVRAPTFRNQEQTLAGFTLDFSVGQGDSTFEVYALITCLSLTRRLITQRWIREDQSPGFWQLIDRGWSDPRIANALSSDRALLDLVFTLEKYGLFPYYDLHNDAAVQRAMRETLGIRRLFNR